MKFSKIRKILLLFCRFDPPCSIVGRKSGAHSAARQGRVSLAYRRNWVPGGTFFFTVNLLDRRSALLVARIDALRDAVRLVRARKPFHIDAWVVLPDHMHCLWTLPEGEADFPGRWRAIKIAFAKSLPKGEPRSPVMTGRGERGIWQRRYWEHTIRDDRDFAVHMDYTHFNPVKRADKQDVTSADGAGDRHCDGSCGGLPG